MVTRTTRLRVTQELDILLNHRIHLSAETNYGEAFSVGIIPFIRINDIQVKHESQSKNTFPSKHVSLTMQK